MIARFAALVLMFNTASAFAAWGEPSGTDAYASAVASLQNNGEATYCTRRSNSYAGSMELNTVRTELTKSFPTLTTETITMAADGAVSICVLYRIKPR